MKTELGPHYLYKVCAAGRCRTALHQEAAIAKLTPPKSRASQRYGRADSRRLRIDEEYDVEAVLADHRCCASAKAFGNPSLIISRKIGCAD